ncbi:MAG: WXG100 family type VII secretion target [Mycobacteriaceae bacterium]
MSDFVASPQEIAATGKFVGDVAEQMILGVSGFSAEVDGFLGTKWQGQAARAFAVQWQQWLDGARSVVAALNTSAELLAQNASSFAETEEHNVSSFDAIDVPPATGILNWG